MAFGLLHCIFRPPCSKEQIKMLSEMYRPVQINPKFDFDMFEARGLKVAPDMRYVSPYTYDFFAIITLISRSRFLVTLNDISAFLKKEVFRQLNCWNKFRLGSLLCPSPVLNLRRWLRLHVRCIEEVGE